MGEERKVYKVLMGTPEGKRPLEDQGICGRMGSEWILGRLAWGVEWIQLVQDRDRWRGLVNTVMDLRVLVGWIVKPANISIQLEESKVKK
jgi:hypothetical protein